MEIIAISNVHRVAPAGLHVLKSRSLAKRE